MLRLFGLGYEFPDNHVRALSGVDLALETGRIHALLGENGAGKSTLARIVTGHVRNWKGRMDLGDKEYSPLSPLDALSRGVALVPQHPRLDTSQDLGKNLFMGHSRPDRFLYTRKLREEMGRQLSQWAMDFDLSSPASELDAPGMHWLALAEALLAKPQWLFLDEPSASYPDQEVARLYSLLEKLAGQGMGIVVITHRLREVRKHARTVHVLRQGSLVASRDSSSFKDDASLHALLFPTSPQAEPTSVTVEVPLPPGIPPSARSARAGPGSSHHGLPRTVPMHDPGPGSGDSGLSIRALRLNTGHGRSLALDLAVHRGTTLGILGHWDQGLEDLEDHLAGLRPHQPGSMVFAGRDLDRLEPGLRGYIPSRRFQRGIALGLGIRDNILIRMRGEKNLHDRGNKLSGIRTQVPLPADRDWNQAIETLSGGMIQKLIIHRETALPAPQFLVCAEPWWGLDFQAQAEMARMLKHFNTGNEVTLILSSDIDEIMALSDYATVLGPDGIGDPCRVAGTDRAHWEKLLFRPLEAPRP